MGITQSDSEILLVTARWLEFVCTSPTPDATLLSIEGETRAQLHTPLAHSLLTEMIARCRSRQLNASKSPANPFTNATYIMDFI